MSSCFCVFQTFAFDHCFWSIQDNDPKFAGKNYCKILIYKISASFYVIPVYANVIFTVLQRNMQLVIYIPVFSYSVYFTSVI